MNEIGAGSESKVLMPPTPSAPYPERNDASGCFKIKCSCISPKKLAQNEHLEAPETASTVMVDRPRVASYSTTCY